MLSFGTVWKLTRVSDPLHSPEDGSNTMKGGSREAKELKSRGGENMLQETGDSNPPLPPPPT